MYGTTRSSDASLARSATDQVGRPGWRGRRGRLSRVLLLGAAAALGVVIGGTPGPARAVDSCDLAGVKLWDGGGANNRWDTAANWAGDALPTSTEHVCIPSSANVAEVLFSTGTATVQSLDARKPLSITGGTLTLGNSAQPSALTAGLKLSGGGLAGASPRRLGGTVTMTGGSISGPGTTTVPAGTTLAISGTSTKNIHGPIVNEGTITLDGTGGVFLNTGSSINNPGEIRFLSDTDLSRSGSDGIVTNTSTGVILKKAGVESTLASPLENDGTVRSDAGTLTLTGGTAPSTASAGKLAAAANSSVVIDGGTHTYEAPAALAGPGTVVLQSGTLTGTFDVPNGATLVQNGGTLRGSSTADLTVSSGGVYSAQTSSAKNMEGRIANAGTMKFGASLWFQNVAKLTNSGTIEVIEGAVLDCCGSGSPNQIVNTSTGKINHTGAPASVGVIDVPVDNDGTVQSLGGRLNLTGGTGSTGASTGVFTTAAGTVVAFEDGITRFAAGGKLGGAGIQVNGGTLIGPFQVPSGGVVTQKGGTIEGPTDGTPPAKVLLGGTYVAAGAANKHVEGAFENAGTWRYAGYAWHENHFLLDNKAAIEIVDGAEIACCGAGGPHVINNLAGATMKKIGLADSTATVSVAIDNDGTITAESGVLSLRAGTGTGNASTGQYGALTGVTSLRFDDGTYRFDPNGRIAGPGSTVVAGGATITGPWTIKSGAKLTQQDGALRGPTSTGTALIENGGKVTVTTANAKEWAGSIRNLGLLSVAGYVWSDPQMQLTIGEKGVLDLNGSPEIDCCGSPGPILIRNELGGTIRKTGAETSTGYIDVPVENDGTIKAIGGVLALRNGTPAGAASSGEYNAQAGTPAVRFAGGTHQFEVGGRITGPGQVQVTDGTIQGPFTVKPNGVLAQLDGSVRGPSDDEQALIEAGGLYLITTTASKDVGGRIRNLGTVRQDGYIFAEGVLELVNGSGGVIEFVGNANFDCCVGGPQVLVNEAGGLVMKTGGRASVAFVEIGVDNDGIVRSDGGILDLWGGTGAAHGSTGEYTAAARQTVRFGNGVHRFEPGGRITGPGTVEAADATIEGPFTVKTGGKLLQTNGALRGPTIDGVDPAVIEPGGTLHVTNGNSKEWAGSLRNDGLTLVDGYVFGDAQLDFVNTGTLQLDGAPNLDCCGSPGPQLVTNTGTIRKTGTSASKASFEIPLDNDGAVRSESGSLELWGGSGPESSTGEYTASAGGPAVRFLGGTHRIGTGGRVTGPGTVILGGARVDGPLTVKSGGTLAFQDGDLWAPLSGSGQVTVDAGGTLKVVASSSKSFRGPIVNNGQMTVTGPVWFDNNVTLTNNATLDLSGSGLMDCCGTGTHLITNTALGLVRVKGGTPVVEPTFDNQGTVSVDGGKVHFWEPADFVGGNLSGGTWRVKGQLGLRAGGLTTVSAPADLRFEGVNAAVVNIDGLDAAKTLATNSGTITVVNRAHNFPKLTNTGLLEAGPGAAITLPQLIQNGGRTFIDPTAKITATTGVALNGGRLEGSGRIIGNLINTGTAPPVLLRTDGELDVEGKYTQQASGEFEAELTNTGTGIVQRQIIGTNLGQLGGILRVRASDTFVPVAGDTYVLGTFTSLNGTFATLDFEALSSGKFEVWYSTTEFGVRVVSA